MVEKVELTDGRILLRPYRSEDAERLFEAATESIAELLPWMDWCLPGYSIDESRTWVAKQDEVWRKGTDYNFSIVDRVDDSYLGGCGLNHFDLENKFCSLGYWVRTSRTKHGTATASARLLAQFAFQQLALLRVNIVEAVDNKTSQRVAEKAGALREGVLRNVSFYHNRTHDMVMFSLIPGDL